MQQLTISRDNAVKAYQAGSPKQKKLLEDLFGVENLDLDITELVGSYEDACRLRGVIPLSLSDFAFLGPQRKVVAYADHQLDILNEALNEGHVFDYDDPDERKYYPLLKKTGSGFALFVVVCDRTVSYVGPRRSFRTEKAARYCATKFIHLYNQSFQQQ